MVDFKHYTVHGTPESNISLKKSGEMNGLNDVQLLKSFYHSRQEPQVSFYHSRKEPQESHQCNYSGHDKYNDYTENAGAVLLYNAITMEPYNIPGKGYKEYHITTDGLKFANRSYDHSERILMRDILDDLILSDLKSLNQTSRYPPIPSLNGNKEDEVLKNLTKRASEYRYYLKRKGLVVKMWSERNACNTDGGGSNCRQFLRDICPEGSKYGYISKSDNCNDVEKLSKEFMKACKNPLNWLIPSSSVTNAGGGVSPIKNQKIG